MKNTVKQIVVKFDKKFLGGILARVRKLTKSKKLLTIYQLSEVKKAFKYSLNTGYIYSSSNLLNILCDKYGSDKGETKKGGHPYPWPSHTYTDVYEILFQPRRNDVKSLIECGVGTNNPDLPSSMGINGIPGASLRVWRDYFPDANIIGLDIDKDILFEEERIKTYYCDQTSAESIQNFIESADLKPQSVDVIIDDALHEFQAGVCLLENLYKYLARDGYYIIEDVCLVDFSKYKEYFSKKSKKFKKIRLIDALCPDETGILDYNRLIVIT